MKCMEEGRTSMEPPSMGKGTFKEEREHSFRKEKGRRDPRGRGLKMSIGRKNAPAAQGNGEGSEERVTPLEKKKTSPCIKTDTGLRAVKRGRRKYG